MKSLVTPLVSLLLVACVTTASAVPLVNVTVTDQTTGRQLDVYRHRGKLYVAGVPGNRYAIQVENRSGGRVMAVVSVDGVNVVSGQTAAVSQQGYVLSPWQTSEISGWRKSTEEVAAFYFTSVEDSYAGRTDRPRNVGVLAVAAFREEVPQPVALPETPPGPPLAAAEGTASPQAAGDSAFRSMSKAEASNAVAEKLGTGHGERIVSPTHYTEFRRARSRPDEVVSIFYDSRSNLIAQGIIPSRPVSRIPNPFPGGFVPDPS